MKDRIVIAEKTRFRDGGTILAVDSEGKEYFVDRRIGTKTPYAVYDRYPGGEGATRIEGKFLLYQQYYIG